MKKLSRMQVTSYEVNAGEALAYWMMVEKRVYFVSYGIGTITQGSAQLTISAKQAAIRLSGFCNSCTGWNKEFVFMHIFTPENAAAKIAEAAEFMTNTAIFFVCNDIKTVNALRAALNVVRKESHDTPTM